jgi:hypothetical protein
LQAGVDAVLGKPNGTFGKSNGKSSASLDMKDPLVAQLAFAVDIVRQAIDVENGVALPVLHPILMQILPSLLKVQVAPPLQSHLWFLHVVSKKTITMRGLLPTMRLLFP